MKIPHQANHVSLGSFIQDFQPQNRDEVVGGLAAIVPTEVCSGAFELLRVGQVDSAPKLPNHMSQGQRPRVGAPMKCTFGAQDTSVEEICPPSWSLPPLEKSLLDAWRM